MWSRLSITRHFLPFSLPREQTLLHIIPLLLQDNRISYSFSFLIFGDIKITIRRLYGTVLEPPQYFFLTKPAFPKDSILFQSLSLLHSYIHHIPMQHLQSAYHRQHKEEFDHRCLFPSFYLPKFLPSQ